MVLLREIGKSEVQHLVHEQPVIGQVLPGGTPAHAECDEGIIIADRRSVLGLSPIDWLDVQNDAPHRKFSVVAAHRTGRPFHPGDGRVPQFRRRRIGKLQINDRVRQRDVLAP